MTPGYLSGFGNSFETEALQGALPVGRNSPQKVNYGLYAEQLSGSPFTAPRASNQRSWLYRIRPTVRHTRRFHRVDKGHLRTAPAREDSDLPLLAFINGKVFGKATTCNDMTFDFPTLIVHAAKTRALASGTILGAGTVSNRDAHGGSIFGVIEQDVIRYERN